MEEKLPMGGRERRRGKREKGEEEREMRGVVGLTQRKVVSGREGKEEEGIERASELSVCER